MYAAPQAGILQQHNNGGAPTSYSHIPHPLFVAHCTSQQQQHHHHQGASVSQFSAQPTLPPCFAPQIQNVSSLPAVVPATYLYAQQQQQQQPMQTVYVPVQCTQAAPSAGGGPVPMYYTSAGGGGGPFYPAQPPAQQHVFYSQDMHSASVHQQQQMSSMMMHTHLSETSAEAAAQQQQYWQQPHQQPFPMQVMVAHHHHQTYAMVPQTQQPGGSCHTSSYPIPQLQPVVQSNTCNSSGTTIFSQSLCSAGDVTECSTQFSSLTSFSHTGMSDDFSNNAYRVRSFGGSANHFVSKDSADVNNSSTQNQLHQQQIPTRYASSSSLDEQQVASGYRSPCYAQLESLTVCGADVDDGEDSSDLGFISFRPVATSVPVPSSSSSSSLINKGSLNHGPLSGRASAVSVGGALSNASDDGAGILGSESSRRYGIVMPTPYSAAMMSRSQPATAS